MRKIIGVVTSSLSVSDLVIGWIVGINERNEMVRH